MKQLPVLSFAVVILTALAIACGGAEADKSPTVAFNQPGGGTAPTQAAGSIDASATCGPAGNAIANIKRSGQRTFAAAPERVIDPAKTYVALMKTSKGDVTVELTARDTPVTVNSFVFLSCTGFYDGLTFHRYEAGFVIQGGDPQGNGRGGPGYRFQTEINPNLRHEAAGVLAMANSGANTNGSQFYITLGAAPHLDNPPAYNVFGRVTSGLDAVRAIRAGDRITSISIEER